MKWAAKLRASERTITCNALLTTHRPHPKTHTPIPISPLPNLPRCSHIPLWTEGFSGSPGGPWQPTIACSPGDISYTCNTLQHRCVCRNMRLHSLTVTSQNRPWANLFPMSSAWCAIGPTPGRFANPYRTSPGELSMEVTWNSHQSRNLCSNGAIANEVKVLQNLPLLGW